MALCFPKRCFIVILAFSLLPISCTPAFAVDREPVVGSDEEYPATPEKVVEEYVLKYDDYHLSPGMGM